MNKIRLNKKFYSKETVVRVKILFQECAVLEIDEDTDAYTIRLMYSMTPPESRILSEFANHCIAESRY